MTTERGVNLEQAYHDGQRAIREFEQEDAYRLPHVAEYQPAAWRPNWARDRLKGAAGD